jgi:hypothetical protein
VSVPLGRSFIELGSSISYNRIKGGILTKLFTLVLLGIGVSALAMASPVPEIDPGTGINAIALLGGGLLLIRSRRKK